MEKRKLLKPKIDVVFHSLFKVGNENITKAIISAVTKEKIEKINLNNDRFIMGKYPEEKIGILDLRATLDDGTICNIEIQLADNKDTAERFLYYWSRIYSSQLVKGEEYSNLNKVIGIIILDYEFEKTKEIERISTKWKITEVNTGKKIELTDILEMFIIEIPKAKRILEKDANNQLAQWMLFLNDPNEKEVSKIMEQNKEIKEAMKELEEMSKDEELRRLAELKEKAIRDEKSAKYRWTEEGIKQGIEQGIEQGVKRDKREIIERLMDLGKPYEEILEIIQLPKEEVDIMIKEIENQKGSTIEELKRLAELKEKAIRDEKSAKYRWTEEGIKQSKREIAKEMKKKDIPIDIIVEITNLTSEEVQKL